MKVSPGRSIRGYKIRRSLSLRVALGAAEGAWQKRQSPRKKSRRWGGWGDEDQGGPSQMGKVASKYKRDLA